MTNDLSWLDLAVFVVLLLSLLANRFLAKKLAKGVKMRFPQ